MINIFDNRLSAANPHFIISAGGFDILRALGHDFSVIRF